MTRPLIKINDPAQLVDQSDILNCVMSERTATYLSVPITTGKRFLQWYLEEGRLLEQNSKEYELRHQREVIEPNCRAAQHVLQKLRSEGGKIVIEPTALTRPQWNQDQYRYFWGKVIERYVRQVVFLDGWQYSSGCCYEYLMSSRYGARTVDENAEAISRRQAACMIKPAIDEMDKAGLSVLFLQDILREIQGEADRDEAAEPVASAAVIDVVVGEVQGALLKDTVLDAFAKLGNVAQFVSFGPGDGLHQRYCWINGFEPGHRFQSPTQAVELLLKNSPDGTVNVRSFLPEQPKGEPLHYGISDADSVIRILKEKAERGRYTIVNETVDVNDGGVSGVVMGDILEFTPDDTPKGVDKPRICSMSRDAGLRLFRIVYGFRPALDYNRKLRVEFSIHPRERGFRRQHTIVWELEPVDKIHSKAVLRWPNRFSMMLGDKAFGLLLADVLGLPVPFTTVVSRHVAPFSFGRQTGVLENWMRTCPASRTPGKYPTTYGWSDPFKAAGTDEHDQAIVSVISQLSVRPEYSGSLVSFEDGTAKIEGVTGKGDRFMLGEVPPDKRLPGKVREAVNQLYKVASDALGLVEIEWVFDGKVAWIVQLNQAQVPVPNANRSLNGRIKFVNFEVSQGLDALREMIRKLKGVVDAGIALRGDVGVTSHFGDLLRQASIPSRIEYPDGHITRVY